MVVASVIPATLFPIDASGSTARSMGQVPFDVVVFDLDGTLADTALDLAASLNHALVALNRAPVTVEQVRRMVGHGTRALMTKGLAATGIVNDALVDRGFALLLDYYAAHIADYSKPYAGVEAALDALEKDGVRLAICTNKPEARTHALIEAFGWQGRFAGVVGGDTLPQCKPDPAPVHETIRRAGGGRAAFVGDSISDTGAARAAGLPCVALTFGYSDRPADQLGATALIDHWDELLPTLARLG
jgi:phosphoglycolate phosphatase